MPFAKPFDAEANGWKRRGGRGAVKHVNAVSFRLKRSEKNEREEKFNPLQKVAGRLKGQCRKRTDCWACFPCQRSTLVM